MMSTFKNIAAVVAICFTVSMVWCDDIDCAGITAIDRCVSMTDAPACDHDSSPSASPDAHHASHCSCLCHVASVDFEIAALCYTPPLEIVDASFNSRIAPVPGRTIFRPPMAA